MIPHSALNIQAIPDSAKKKGPIPPFRQPENPPHYLTTRLAEDTELEIRIQIGMIKIVND